MAYVTEHAGTQAAILAGKSAEMDVVAGRALRAVRTVAQSHRLTGNYISKLGILTVPGVNGNGRLVDDRLVVADDEAAAAIEWGHFQGKRTKSGRRVSTSTLRWVPGQHIMTRGLAMVR